jgi:hypothetical protein
MRVILLPSPTRRCRCRCHKDSRRTATKMTIATTGPLSAMSQWKSFLRALHAVTFPILNRFETMLQLTTTCFAISLRGIFARVDYSDSGPSWNRFATSFGRRYQRMIKGITNTRSTRFWVVPEFVFCCWPLHKSNHPVLTADSMTRHSNSISTHTPHSSFCLQRMIKCMTSTWSTRR